MKHDRHVSVELRLKVVQIQIVGASPERITTEACFPELIH